MRTCRRLGFKVNSQRMKGRSKNTWIRQAEEDIRNASLRNEDATSLTQWKKGVKKIAMM